MGVQRARVRWKIALTSLALILTSWWRAGTPTSGAAPEPREAVGARPALTLQPEAITLQPSTPYYVAADALTEPQVRAGTDVGGCIVTAFTHCEGVDLSDQNLQGAFLAYSNLTNAHLADVDLLQADVAFAHLGHSDLREARVSATATTRASFADATLNGSQWVLVAASDTDFSGSDLSGANFTSAGLTSADFRGANLSGANFTLADLTGADLSGADLKGAVFCQTVMPNGTVRSPRPSAPRQSGPADIPRTALAHHWPSPARIRISPSRFPTTTTC